MSRANLSMSKSSPSPSPTARILYDGECPACQSYIRFSRLREALGAVDLINAREAPDLVSQYRAQGCEINEGLILDFRDGGKPLCGEEAMTGIAAMSTGSKFFNHLNAAFFQSPRLARIVYPVLAVGRRVLLFLIGRNLIE